MNKRKSAVMMSASMAVFGTIALFVRNIPVSSEELALYRALMAIVLLGSYFLISRKKICLAGLGKELPLLLFSGAAMGMNWILLFEAYRYTTVSVATLSYYFAPVLVTLACPVFFKEKLSLRQLICFIFSTVGLVLVVGVGEISGGGHAKGVLFGLGAAALYATVILLNKGIKKVSGIERTFLQFLAAALVLLPYVLLSDGISLQQMTGIGWACLLVVGFVHTGITYCLYFTALKDLPGQEAAILSYIDPLVAIIISVTLLKESITPLQLLGGALILGFTLYHEIGGQKKKAE